MLDRCRRIRILPVAKDGLNIARQQKRPITKPLSEIAAQYEDRKTAIIAAYKNKTGTYSQRKIVEFFDAQAHILHQSGALQGVQPSGFTIQYFLVQKQPCAQSLILCGYSTIASNRQMRQKSFNFL